MTQIRIKRVYENYSEDDGFRVLVDKLWPRGIKKEALKMDMWNKDVTPSTELRKWYHEDTENRWKEFQKHYLRELSLSDKVKGFVTLIEKYKTVTLLYASKNTTQNHAIVLKSYLDEQLRNS
jgi:uncharacterized protein YeaO (DUF488 family)